MVAQPDSEQQAVHAGDIVSGDTGKVKPWRKNWTVQHGIAECAVSIMCTVCCSTMHTYTLRYI